MPDASPWKILPLPLEVDGKLYEVQPAEYEVGLSILEGVSKGEDDKRPPHEVFAEMMGEQWQRMRDDKVPYHIMFRAGLASLTFQTALVVVGLSSDEAVKRALAIWNEAPTPEQVAADLQETLRPAADPKRSRARKQPAKKVAPRSRTASTTSSSSASAGKTPPRASTSPTRSRKTTPQPK